MRSSIALVGVAFAFVVFCFVMVTRPPQTVIQPRPDVAPTSSLIVTVVETKGGVQFIARPRR